MKTLPPFAENLRARLPLDKLRFGKPDMARLKKRLQPRSALALTLEADRIAVSVMRLHLEDDGRDVIPVSSVPIGADDVFKHPEKAGGILAAALEAAGVREKRCAVCVPPAWALVASTDLPAVAPDDLRGYLELRAEREFPIALSELRLGYSPYTLPDGTRRATLAALPSRRLEAVETMLAAAGRRAVSVSLALGDALAADGGDPAPALHFLASPGHTDVVVTAGGGVAALRSLPGPAGDAAKPEEGSSLLASDSPPAVFDPVAFARDIRITLGRLPQAISQGVRLARFGGTPESAGRLRREIRDGLWRMGIESLEDEPIEGSSTRDAGSLTAENAAASRLRREFVPFEFVVFQPHRVEALYTRYNTQFYRRVAAVAACIVFLPALAFFARGQYESHLTSQWEGMRDNVADLDGLQQKIRRFRPWFEPTPSTVQALEGLFDVFPETGEVWAKSIQVNSAGAVACTGFARTQPAVISLLTRLRGKPGFSGATLKNQRGEAPAIQFTITCQWGGGSK